MVTQILLLGSLALAGAASLAQQSSQPEYFTQKLEFFRKNGVQTFYAQVEFGTPPQSVPALFSTATGLTYVVSVDCGDPDCEGRPSYNATASSTSQEDGTPFELPYNQNGTGVLAIDKLTLAGASISGQTIGALDHVFNKFGEAMPTAAVVSLGFSNASDSFGTVPPVELMKQQGLVKRAEFGLWLGDNSGELTLGGINADKFTGDMNFVDINRQTHLWSMDAESIGIVGHEEVNLCQEGCPVTIVSNTPYFLVSMNQSKLINELLGAREMAQHPGFYVFECDNICNLPLLRIKLGNFTVEMEPAEYTVVTDFGEVLHMCASGFIGIPLLDEAQDMWTLGTRFLQKVFTEYDMENDRVGFAISAKL